MSNSLGYIRSSASVEAVRTLQPKMFLESEETKTYSKTVSIVEKPSSNVKVEINATRITIMHLMLMLIYAGASFVVFYFGNLDLNAPLFVEKNRINESSEIITPDSILSESVDLPFTWLVGIFFGLAALSNFTSITLFRKYYLEGLRHCVSPIRWTEYFFLSSLMTFIVGSVIGIDSIFLLLSLSVLISTSSLFGLWTEMLARPSSSDSWSRPFRIRVMPFLFSVLPSTFVMTLMVVYFYLGQDPKFSEYAHLNAKLWVAFTLFPQFILVLAFQQYFTPKRYQRVEMLYQFVSLVVRLTIGGLLFAYVLRNDEWYDQFS